MEANNTVEKVTRNNFGIRPMFGITQPSSRFASRSVVESLLGPTFGSLLDTTMRVAGSAAAEAGDEKSGWTDADTRAMRRLLPYQNLFIFRQAIDKLEKLAE